MPDHRVALFSRYPMPGKSKTRLIPALGSEGASQCQVLMTERLLSELRTTGLTIEVWYAGGDLARMRYWLDRRWPGLRYKEQKSKDLGANIAAAFNSAFSEGADKVIVVGADIPDLSGDHVLAGMDALGTREAGSEASAVIQAAADGGYVMVGLTKQPGRNVRNVTKDLFCSGGIHWGTETVLNEQLEAASNAGVVMKVVGSALHDVDLPEDLHVFERACNVSKDSLRLPRVAVVVPLLNEARNIGQTAPTWLKAAKERARVKVILVDGGSTDGTVAIVEGLQKEHPGVMTLKHSPKGRGQQLHEGIAEAYSQDADVIVFVHADTVLPEEFDCTACDILRTPGVSCGAFRLSLDQDSLGLRFVCWGANLRSSWRELPYGDQAIFVSCPVLESVGGIRKDYPLLEDLELVTRLRKVGHVVTAQQAVVSSARRWLQHGVLKVTVVNQAVLILFSCGVSPDTLGQWYYGGARYWWVFLVPLLAMFVGLAHWCVVMF